MDLLSLKNNMDTLIKTNVTVESEINAPVEKVWRLWTDPQFITIWDHATDDWHTPCAENDLHEGGRFKIRMESKSGDEEIGRAGTYTKIDSLKRMDYKIDDGRKVRVDFIPKGSTTTVRETFETEMTNPVEMQRDGWQAILNNFKKFVESFSSIAGVR